MVSGSYNIVFGVGLCKTFLFKMAAFTDIGVAVV